MPQLDRFAYVSQVIWLIAIFLVLYFILVVLVLPRIYKILRFRKTKIKQLRVGVINCEQELIFLDMLVKIKLMDMYNNLKTLPESLLNIVEKGLEEERNKIKVELDSIKDVKNLSVLNNDSLILNDLDLCQMLDNDIFIKEKEKNEIRRRIIKG